jgi:hypothetical protein
VNTHLLISALSVPDCKVWSFDLKLKNACEQLGVVYNSQALGIQPSKSRVLVIRQSTIRKIREKHYVSNDIIYELDALLTRSPLGLRNNWMPKTVVQILDSQDKDGDFYIVPISIEQGHSPFFF